MEGTYKKERETKNSWRYQLQDGIGPDTIYLHKTMLRQTFGKIPETLIITIKEKKE